MSNPHVFVAIVTGVEGSGQDLDHGKPVTVHFGNGQSTELAPSDPRSQTYAAVLGELSSMTLAAYVEADPESGAIKRLLVPLEDKVTNFRRTPLGDIEVQLEVSDVVHYLKRTHPNFEQLLKTLQDARDKGIPAWVTDDEDENEIVDVRLPNPPSSAGRAPAPALPTKPSQELRSITPGRALELFRLVAHRNCNPVISGPSCIPFLYPNDGCAARAHEMCRLMIAAGEQPCKLWIYGSLRLDTPNDPRCKVEWIYHVAPTLNVDIGLGNQVQVIDPAICDQPVSTKIWKSKMNDPQAICEPTDYTPFKHQLDPETGEDLFDPDFIKTAISLVRFRSDLWLRSLTKGPPPYANCPKGLTACS